MLKENTDKNLSGAATASRMGLEDPVMNVEGDSDEEDKEEKDEEDEEGIFT